LAPTLPYIGNFSTINWPPLLPSLPAGPQSSFEKNQSAWFSFKAPLPRAVLKFLQFLLEDLGGLSEEGRSELGVAASSESKGHMRKERVSSLDKASEW